MNKKNVLVLGAHPDDVEFCCGSYVMNLSKQYNVYYVVASSTVEQPTNKNILHELETSAKFMGVKDLILLDYPNTRLPENALGIRNRLFKLKKELDPVLVIGPSQNEIHQDHKILSDETIRTFRTGTILGWICEWSNIKSTPSFFYILDQEEYLKKRKLMNIYKSQSRRSYINLFESAMVVNGARIGVDFAEGLEVMRWVEKK